MNDKRKLRVRHLMMATVTMTAANFLHSTPGEARVRHAHKVAHGHLHSVSFNVASSRSAHRHWGRIHSSGHVIQCVAFAQAESAVDLHGNARDWWHNAAGRYARGAAPEVGSVLNFRPIRRMPLGHVAVVTGRVNDRVILIDQSHWAQNGISRNVRVVDVSPENDWSAVRVELNGRNGTFGSIYPTFGFIYPRSEGASPVMTASAERFEMDPGLQQVAEASEAVGTLEEGYRAPAPRAVISRRHAHFRKHARHS
ncbi:CHAP domain-containing protein [Acetobacter estunensis]